jgi:DOPA 4,5-dioxygenase
MPTSFESLQRHRAARADGPTSGRVWFFHSHSYFAAEHEADARAFMDRIRKEFASNSHIEVHTFVPFPVGPHPRGNFEVLFTREAFAEYVAWLMFERPDALSILIHPLTRSQMDDHTSRALWLGAPLPLEKGILERSDANSAARSEESIIEGAKRH